MICHSLISYRRRRWLLPTHDQNLVTQVAQDLRLPPLIANLLVARNITTAPAAHAFLEPKFRDLHSPYLLPNMHTAAERIAHAVREKQKITIFGDYDVDGITGTAMLWHTLKTAGAN